MELNKYQKYSYKSILNHDKNILLWNRQLGKTTIILHYIRNFILNNINTDIIFFSNSESFWLEIRSKIFNSLGKYVIENTSVVSKKIRFINNNDLKFISINNYDYFIDLIRIKPELIIFDEIWNMKNEKLDKLHFYVCNNSCKVILTGTNISMENILFLDSQNDYYININSDSITYNEITNEIRKWLSYKPNHLIDFDNILFQRKKKLERLKKITNGE